MQLDRTSERRAARRRSAIELLLDLNRQLFATPEDFNVHRKLKPQREKRFQVGPDDPIDWGQAEALAFASLLDGRRAAEAHRPGHRCAGTFSQRHLVLVDTETGERYAPIQHLKGAKSPFELHNSPLSEAGALGFEYGYSAAAPEVLVMWEAQFGDFVNAAQVIIDQFLVSALAKWGETSRADPAAAARLRGIRPRALERARRAFPDACRRGQHPLRERDHDRRSTSTCCGARRWSRSAGRWSSSRPRACCATSARSRRCGSSRPGRYSA